MEGDYIKLYRKMLNWEWYRDINTSRLYLHMLLSANWKDGTYQGETVPRGSFISSRKRLSKQTGMTEQEIKTALLYLEATGEVTSKENKNTTVFTVQHYHVYQANDKQTDKKETDNRQTNDMQTTTRVEGDYIKLYRKMLDWEWYTDCNTSRLFLHMLLLANWKEGRIKSETVPRGSFISSIKNLKEQTGLTEREVRTAISHLKLTGEVTSKATNKYTVFTVQNYHAYQANDEQTDNEETDKRQTDRQTSDKQTDEQAAGRRHTNDIQTTTIEERKKERKEEGKEKEKVKKEMPPVFERFVERYQVSDSLTEKIREWLQYKAERREPYQEQGMNSLFCQIQKYAEKVGEDAVMELMEECMAANWKGIIWDRLKSGSETGKHKQQNPFQNFHQRSYDFDKLERQLLKSQGYPCSF